MKTVKKSKKDETAVQTGEGCCGGPAPEGVAACCVKDAEAKAIGEEGCGCGASPVQASAPPSACCGAGSQPPEETSVANPQNGSSLSNAPSHDSVRQAVRQQYGRVAAGAAGCGSGQGCCDAPMAIALRDGFQYKGYAVQAARDGVAGLRMASEAVFDIMILDVMLPRLSGLDVCKQLRSAGNHVPIIMLTARGQEIDKVVGLETGIDHGCH